MGNKMLVITVFGSLLGYVGAEWTIKERNIEEESGILMARLAGIMLGGVFANKMLGNIKI